MVPGGVLRCFVTYEAIDCGLDETKRLSQQIRCTMVSPEVLSAVLSGWCQFWKDMFLMMKRIIDHSYWTHQAIVV